MMIMNRINLGVIVIIQFQGIDLLVSVPISKIHPEIHWNIQDLSTNLGAHLTRA
jgi:hypothetical protein